LKVPDAAGVPLIVITLLAQTAVTPAGNPVAVPIPVAPVVVIVIDGVKAVFTISVIGDAVPAVFGVHAETVIVPVASTLPQPPVKGIV
jgi:hypothetical protein